MNEDSAVITCKDLRKCYQQGPETLVVLDGINMQLQRGENAAIIGASGAGKSTLLNLLGGLDDPTGGEVVIANKSWAGLDEKQRARLRNQTLGFVYQFHHLMSEFSAAENVAMPSLIAGKTKRQAHERARELLASVGLAERSHHKPAQLSGGERQRVAVARSLANSPACVLMDEPTGNLDKHTADQVQSLLLRLSDELNMSFLIVTHDLELAKKLDHIWLLGDGHLKPLDDDNAL